MIIIYLWWSFIYLGIIISTCVYRVSYMQPSSLIILNSWVWMSNLDILKISLRQKYLVSEIWDQSFRGRYYHFKCSFIFFFFFFYFNCLIYINVLAEFSYSCSTTQPGQTHRHTTSQHPFPATLPSAAAETRTQDR